MRKYYLLALLLFLPLYLYADEGSATYITPDYQEPKVVYDIYLDDPRKMTLALHWLRSLMNPLMDSPYDMPPDFMEIKMVIHGAELVTLAKKNYSKYKNVVERMRYYASLGVSFRVCAIAASDYDYELHDLYDFVEVVPSAFADLVHWQQQGYALITPQIMDKKFSVEELR